MFVLSGAVALAAAVAAASGGGGGVVAVAAWSLLTALCTGAGVTPFLFIRDVSHAAVAYANATAAGT